MQQKEIDDNPISMNSDSIDSYYEQVDYDNPNFADKELIWNNETNCNIETESDR